MFRFYSLVGLALCLSSSAVAGLVTDFEGHPDSTVITSQYPGFTFSNTIVYTAGITLNDLEFPPFSGVNVASDDGGAITIVFATPVLDFSGYFTYTTQLTMTAYDAGANQVDQRLSLFSNNLAVSGDLGSSPNEFLGVVYAGGIASITIAGDPLGGSFTMDGPLAVPEPAPFTFFLPTVIAIAVTARRRAFKHQ